MVCYVIVSDDEKKDLKFLLFHLVFDERKGTRFTIKKLKSELKEKYGNNNVDDSEISSTLSRWSNLGWIRENAFDYQVVSKGYEIT